ncbi:MAG: RNA polymerase sigma factor [Chitinispirillaceae bacterium]|nr:RNA polymerase sigma factor [Chitinispirillaceae bacterium]
MAGIKGGTEQELQSLYERYASLVQARCRSILRCDDEAWDATQDIFMKLYAALPRIEKKESIYSWLLSASTNHCISLLRKRRSIAFNEEIHSVPNENQVPPQEKTLLLKEVLHRFLMPWDKKIRDVVLYAYFDGYKQEEIARLTGLGESTVRKYLTRFKRKAAGSGLAFEEVHYG